VFVSETVKSKQNHNSEKVIRNYVQIKQFVFWQKCKFDWMHKILRLALALRAAYCIAERN
jgi:hypothetical protein